MDQKKINALISSTTEHFKMLGYTEAEVTLSLIYMDVIMSALTGDYMFKIIGKDIAVMENILPYFDEKFPELLRAVANMIEAKIEEHLREQKNEN